jgi:DNA processing protein
MIRDAMRLARSEGVGPVAYRRLIQRFGTPAEALRALPELARAGGRRTAPRIPDEIEIERELRGVERLGGQALAIGDAAYPAFLALIDDAPPILSVLGDPRVFQAQAVALVGARNASANGQRMAEALAHELAEAGFAVVSGLARGVDAAAHRGALAAGGAKGRTIAAIAGGLDMPYPPEHADLQRQVAEGGAVVAEAPLGTTPQARHFPRRNRIIAGLSLGVVVVEAALRSGSLITARLALEMSRELFAVPGSPLDPRCRGSNDLIRQGAHLTETASDVIRALPDHPLREGLGRDPLFQRGPAPPGLAEPEAASPAGSAPDAEADRTVLALIGADPVPVDDLVRRCQLSAAAVLAALLDLDLAGRIETLPGHRVARLADPPE